MTIRRSEAEERPRIRPNEARLASGNQESGSVLGRVVLPGHCYDTVPSVTTSQCNEPDSYYKSLHNFQTFEMEIENLSIAGNAKVLM